MTEAERLFCGTNAYRIVKNDKAENSLSHAYLLLTEDRDNLKVYLKLLAKLIVCREGEACGKCRSCAGVERETFSDVLFLPQNGQKLSVDDVDFLIGESYIKPIESQTKIFVLTDFDGANASIQNKLLKTLEEPNPNVCILLGAASEYPVLSTVKSRVKKLEIPPFTDDTLIGALSGVLKDSEKLRLAVLNSDKSLGDAVRLYNDKSLSGFVELSKSIVIEMNSSRDVLKFSSQLLAHKDGIEQFLNVFENILRDMLVLYENKPALCRSKAAIECYNRSQKFSEGAVLDILQDVALARKKLFFNANNAMLAEWFLFRILEDKYKWQKL